MTKLFAKQAAMVIIAAPVSGMIGMRKRMTAPRTSVARG